MQVLWSIQMIDISLPVLQMDILKPMKTKDKKEVKK